MSKTAAPEAPGADTAKTPKPTPNRKKRYSYFDDGKDYVILAVQRDESGAPIPNGPLVLVPEVPRFESASEALRWIRQSGEKLQGLKVNVVRMMHSVSVVVENKPQITVNEDKRFEREVGESGD